MWRLPLIVLKKSLSAVRQIPPDFAMRSVTAWTSGIREIKDVMNQAEAGRKMGLRTVLFVDEIHRFNKAQQDITTSVPYLIPLPFLLSLHDLA